MTLPTTRNRKDAIAHTDEKQAEGHARRVLDAHPGHFITLVHEEFCGWQLAVWMDHTGEFMGWVR